MTVAGGKPVIAPLPGLSKTFVAAGHEGEGLSLASFLLSLTPFIDFNFFIINCQYIYIHICKHENVMHVLHVFGF